MLVTRIRRHTRCGCDWSSDVCSSDLDHCGCEACSSRCSVCAEDFCGDHGIAQCRVDEQPACDEHVRVCPSCRLQHCTAHEGVCAEDGHTACSACLAPCGDRKSVV